MVKSVLFVCSGNTCRSPMAEAWFKHLCEENNVDIAVGSAGLSDKAAQGNPASDNAVAVMAEYKINLRQYLSRKITPEMVDEYDLIVVMDKKGYSKLTPQAEGKVFRLMHFSTLNPEKDVPNPFRGNLKKYIECFSVMKEAVENLFDQIRTEKEVL